MTATTLPKGITLYTRTTSEGATAIRYRVRVKNDGQIYFAKYFDTLEEAEEALRVVNLAKLRLNSFQGKPVNQSKLQALEEMNLSAEKAVDKLKEATFATLAKKYTEERIETRPNDTELERRNRSNISSIIKTINSTTIKRPKHLFDNGEHGVIEVTEDILFKDLPILDITSYDINLFIAACLKAGKKKSSVSRYVTIISQVFENARESIFYNALDNPTIKHSKRLLRGQPLKKKQRLSEAEADKLFEALEKYHNRDMYFICALALSTAMRRSEIITLTWPQVKDTYIELDITKTKPRNVFLTKEAQQVFHSLRESSVNQRGRVFKGYSSIAGFEGSFYKLMVNLDLAHITFHVFRKEAFSRFFEQLPTATSATMLTEFLGVRSVRKFVDLHGPSIPTSLNTEAEILKSGGHSSTQVQKDHYLSFNSETDN